MFFQRQRISPTRTVGEILRSQKTLPQGDIPLNSYRELCNWGTSKLEAGDERRDQPYVLYAKQILLLNIYHNYQYGKI